MTKPKINVAIDGPAGAGKSTLAKWIARHYQYQLIDTGAMYRTIAFYTDNLNLSDEADIEELCLESHFKFKLMPDLSNLVWMNDREMSHNIRSARVSQLASQISKIRKVRVALVAQQRILADAKGCVMEGRDIGTIVLPDADIKFFMTGTVEVRAKRRLKDLHELGETSTLDEVMESIKHRDHQDETRKISPLKQAHDAILVDTTLLNIKDVFCILREKIDQVISQLN